MHITTLGEFIVQRQQDFAYASGELSRLLSAIRLAAKVVNSQINKAGLVDDIIGAEGNENVQGEQQQKLDVYANNIFIRALQRRSVVCGVGSEENESFIPFEKNSMAKYVLLMDPLDGSSNIDVNVSVGTIFSIFARKTNIGSVCTEEDFLQPGSAQVAAGYIIYGSSTMLVFTTGNGVYGFTFDPTIGVFYLSHERMQIPTVGSTYSINEGNYPYLDKSIRDYIKYCKELDPPTGRPYSSRYIGSMVADFHRILIKGGIFMYPGNTRYPDGKLRLMYECNPMAFIAEQAGGLATTGRERIMDLEPTSLHQRAPLFMGSKNLVKEVEEFIERGGSNA